MSNTTVADKKRRFPSASTPSPSLQRSHKSAKMSSPPPSGVQRLSATSFQNQSQSTTEPILAENLKCLTDEEKWDFIVQHFNKMCNEITEMRAENEDLKASIATANGKVAFLENQVEKAKSKIGETQWRQLQNDVVIYKLAESPDMQDIELVIELFSEKLHLTDDTNALQIDTAFRIGKQISGKTRPLVVSFALQSSKKMVMEQYKKLQKKLDIKITDHFPSEMRERALCKKIL